MHLEWFDVTSGLKIAFGFLGHHRGGTLTSLYQMYPELNESPDDHEHDDLPHSNSNDVCSNELPLLLRVKEAVRWREKSEVAYNGNQWM